MPSVWNTEPEATPDQNQQFDEFLALYSAFEAKKTSDLLRLKIKIDRLWTSYPVDVKRDFTGRLVHLKKLPDWLIDFCDSFGGHISKLV